METFSVFPEQTIRFKKTPVDMNYMLGAPLMGSSCIEDGSTAYVFAIGVGVNIEVVCPLLYDARFLDISPTDFIQFNPHSECRWKQSKKTAG